MLSITEYLLSPTLYKHGGEYKTRLNLIQSLFKELAKDARSHLSLTLPLPAHRPTWRELYPSLQAEQWLLEFHSLGLLWYVPWGQKMSWDIFSIHLPSAGVGFCSLQLNRKKKTRQPYVVLQGKLWWVSIEWMNAQWNERWRQFCQRTLGE